MPRFAANLTMLFTELPMLERFAAAADAGFQGVEILFPYDIPARDLSRAAIAAGLSYALRQQRRSMQTGAQVPRSRWRKR